MRVYSYNKEKYGLPPGTVIYTGKNINENVEIELYSFDSKNFSKKVCDEINFEEIKTNGKYNWINVVGVHNIDLINKIGENFGINNLILEDLTNINQRVKIEEWENYIFIVLKLLNFNKEKNLVETEQISFILGENYLLTFQEKRNNKFEPVIKRIEKSVSKMSLRGIGYIAYAFIDIIVDNYFVVLDTIEEKIDNLEYKILNEFSTVDIKEIMLLKGELSILKKGIFPLRELSMKFQGTEISKYFGKNNKMYLTDLRDHGITVCDILENLVSRSSELFQLYYSSVSNNMNNVMKVLAIISTIFMPLSFLAGIYGMNFVYIPGLQFKYGFLILSFIMIVIMVIMIFYFKKKKWL